MDDKAAYADLHKKMKRLMPVLVDMFPDTDSGDQPGACIGDGGCKNCLSSECGGTFVVGGTCERPPRNSDFAKAYKELMRQMTLLLQHANSRLLKPYTFEAGGKKYKLKMTVQQAKALGAIPVKTKGRGRGGK
jgi:hypothetical protein